MKMGEVGEQKVSADSRSSRLTTGEYRVGISFNPNKDPLVDKIKRASADLIDLVNCGITDPEPEIQRLKALAMTHVEDASMWGVKAATKPPR